MKRFLFIILTLLPFGLSFAVDDTEKVVHLPFDDGQSPATDISGNNNTGAIQGATYSTDTGDSSDQSLDFSGTASGVNVGGVDVAGTGLTLAAWVKADTYPGTSRDPRIISKATGTAANDHIFMLGITNSGAGAPENWVRARVRVGGVTTTLKAGTDPSLDIPTDVWTHVAATYDGTTVRLYKDGVEVASTALAGAVDQDATVDTWVGANSSSDKHWDGKIDDVIISQRAYSAAEINSLFTALPDNDAPVAVNDSAYTMTEGATLNVAASGVLANDTDANSDALTAMLNTDVSQGTLTLNANGGFTYTPTVGFTGQDTFTYFANDGTDNSATAATVTITVEADNDAPVAVNDSGYTMTEGTTLSVPAFGVLTNDTDNDGDALTAVLNTDVSQGTLTLNANGGFDYTPTVGFTGQDTFTYFANDGTTNSATAATVTVTVTSGDIYTTCATVAVCIDPAAGSVTVATGDNLPSDNSCITETVCADTLTEYVSIGGNQDGVVAHLPFDDGQSPATDISGNNNTGDIQGATYSTDTGDSSAQSLDFAGTTDSGVNLGGIDVAGTGLTLAAWVKADTFPGTFRDPYVISKTSSYLQDDHLFSLGGTWNGDSESPIVRLAARIRVGGTTLLTAATDDTYTLVTDTWTHIAATYDGTTVRLYKDGVEIYTRAQAGSVDQDPTVDVWVGARQEGLKNWDGKIDDVIIADRAYSAAEIASLYAGAPNDAPVAVNDSGYTVTEGTTLNVAASGVLANDTDANSDALTAVLNTDVSNGTLTLNANGGFDYTPTVGFTGQDTFTYFANDGTTNSATAATVTVTVTSDGGAVSGMANLSDRGVLDERGLKAFPGAEGYGQDSTGGRNGQLVIVNSLECNLTAGDGFITLPEALSAQGDVSAGNRIVVFDVGGFIECPTNTALNTGQFSMSGNVHVACQTAPAPGIQIIAYRLNMYYQENITIRGCQFFTKEIGTSADGAGGAIRGGVNDDVILDRNNFLHTTDDLTLAYVGPSDSEATATNISVSNSLILEPDNYSGHPDGNPADNTPNRYTIAEGFGCATSNQNHSFVQIVGCSYIGNVFAHTGRRSPQVWSTNGQISNNLVYNCTEDCIQILERGVAPGVDVWLTDNVFKWGPNTTGGYGPYATGHEADADGFRIDSVNARIRIEDNYSILQNASIVNYPPRADTPNIARSDFHAPRDWFAAGGFDCVGTILAHRDANVDRIINEIITGTGEAGLSPPEGTYGDPLKADLFNIPRHYETNPNYYPSTSHPAGYDTDNDGIADAWESANGLNVGVQDHNGDLDGDGYTNIEEFVNSLMRCS